MIPAHRMASAALRVVTKDGTPVAGMQIRADQTASRFLFGCGAFDSVDMFVPHPPESKDVLRRRMDNWLKLFNYGTLPFYWGRYEPTEGHTMQDATMQAALWLREQGVTLKGHPLCWHTVCAPWLLKYSNEEILRRQVDRIHRDVSAFRGVIDMWDVINEVVIMPVFDKYDNAVTRICRELGQVPLVKTVFDAARETNPGAALLINDFNTSAAYEHLIEALLEAGVDISVIGIQSHQHQGYWGAEKVHDVLRRFSRFGLPIHFTENTLVSGDLIPGYIEDLNDWQVPSWPSTPEGEDRQARQMAEMYEILYSHPLVEAITIWDPNDGKWLGAPSGVMHKDGTPKPVFDALMGLVHGDWETHETLTTAADGTASFTGVKGTYRLSVWDRTFTLELPEDMKQPMTLVL